VLVEVPGAPEVEPVPTEGSEVPLEGGRRAEVDVEKGLAEPDPQPTIATAAKETAAKLSGILERNCTYKPLEQGMDSSKLDLHQLSLHKGRPLGAGRKFALEGLGGDSGFQIA
jgi:hypothetical protein